MHLLRSLALAICLVLLSGCTSIYRTPGSENVPASALAIVEYDLNILKGVNVIEVDGKHRGNGFFRSYELTPGEHSMTVALQLPATQTYRAALQILKFQVAAGETYELKFDIQTTGYNSGTWRAWVEDKRTGRLVSSMTEKPSP